MVDFAFILRDGTRKPICAPAGINLLEAAHANNIELEGACEASLACSTCHVILPTATYSAFGEPTEEEEDLLDLAPGLTESSRLGCQVVVDERLQGVEVELPKLSINFYVDGHIPTPH